MGMYDNIFIPKKMIPLNKEELPFVSDKTDWQTKDFDCRLESIKINSEGYIENYNHREYTGEISFYDFINRKFTEFICNIENGKIIFIERLDIHEH